jgi:hypothetical protein
MLRAHIQLFELCERLTDIPTALTTHRCHLSNGDGESFLSTLTHLTITIASVLAVAEGTHT